MHPTIMKLLADERVRDLTRDLTGDPGVRETALLRRHRSLYRRGPGGRR